MAHTFTNLIIHAVFSTKGHIKSLKKERRSEIFAYIAVLIKEKGGTPIIINGVDDHVHILFVLPPSVSLSDMMKFLKSNSSRWFKQRFNVPFEWQKGYGAFSVSRSGVAAVSEYIRDQEEHHTKRSFQDEFIVLLQKNEVDFEEEFLWK